MSFFDDYCQLEFGPLCESAWTTAETLCSLGLEDRCSEEKRLPFDKRFNMLGVVVDLSRSSVGEILMANKPSGVQELVAASESLEQGVQFGGRMQLRGVSCMLPV